MATEDRVMLRLPQGVRETLKAAARASRRSMNGQSIYYVAQGLRLDGFAVPRSERESANEGASTPKSA